jgi:hypothetical protein
MDRSSTGEFMPHERQPSDSFRRAPGWKIADENGNGKQK